MPNMACSSSVSILPVEQLALQLNSVKGFFSVASAASLLPFAPVCLSSVSDSCPYPSCLFCLPLRTSLCNFLFINLSPFSDVIFYSLSSLFVTIQL